MTSPDHLLNASMWSGLEVAARVFLQFLIAIILARLLGPEAFGIIALLSIVTALGALLADSGTSAALIQRQDVTVDDESTVFWFNLATALSLALLLFVLAPFAAEYFEQPVLQQLVPIYAFVVVIGSMGLVPRALMTKQLDFRSQAKVSVIASLMAGFASIGVALLDGGVWALAIQYSVATLITTTFLWSYSSWKPRLIWSHAALRKNLRFGGFILLSSVIDVVYSKFYIVLIGRDFGAVQLGYFERATYLKQLPIEVITSAISRVAFPHFSSVAREPRHLKTAAKNVLGWMAFVCFPISFGMVATAEPLVLSILGNQWAEAAPIFSVLCLSVIAWPLHVLNLTVILANGRSDLFLKVEILKKFIGLVILYVLISYGVMAVAWGHVLMSFLALFINAMFTKKLIDYGISSQIKDVSSIILCSFVMAVAVYWLGFVIEASPGLKLLIQVIFGGSLYILVCMIARQQQYEIVRRQSTITLRMLINWWKQTIN